MFQTEPILFLQSFSNELLDAFFVAITYLGDKEPVQFLIIAVIFGIDFRKGFTLLHMVIWTAFATGLLKDFFALPRPYYVDLAVRCIGRNIANPTPLKSMGADSFWSLPDNVAIEYVRMHRMGSFGFPSGHTSGATALWGGLMVLFQKKWLTVVCGLMIGLIPLSRVYLGRHFIADILGGYLLGCFFLLAVYHLFGGRCLKPFLCSGYRRVVLNRMAIMLMAYLFAFPIMLMLIFPAYSAYPAILLGLNLGFFLVRLKDMPDDSGSVFRRIMRVGIAGLIFLMTGYVFELLFTLINWSEPAVLSAVYPICFMACFVWAATETNILLGLMKRGIQ